jgi:hypothetical protein
MASSADEVTGTVGGPGAVVTPIRTGLSGRRMQPAKPAKVMLFCYEIYVVRLACAGRAM